MRNERPILLVEDDKIDAMTVKRAMNDISLSNPLVHVWNGIEALEKLNKEDEEKPCIILLDLNMPKMNGVEFLTEIKQHPVLKKIPVIVLTTSDAEKDKSECFKHSVAGYMIKPVDYNQFVEVIRKIDIYWTLSELPKQL